MQCDASLLWTLVQQNAEPGAEADSIAKHLESCAGCREKLAEIGGDSSWWDDAQQWLSNDDVDAAADNEFTPRRCCRSI